MEELVFLDVVLDNSKTEINVKVVILNAKNAMEFPIKNVHHVNQEKYYIMVNV